MHAHEEADGNLEKAAVQDPVGEADEVDVELPGVDDTIKFWEVDAPINFGVAGREVVGAENTADFPLLGLLDLMTATSPSVIWPVDLCPSDPILLARALKELLVVTGALGMAVGIFLVDGATEERLRGF